MINRDDQVLSQKETKEEFEQSEFVQITQKSYKASQYEDLSFKVLGDPPKDAIFIPMSLGVVKENKPEVDPMFDDFGGKYEGKTEHRWHLPDHIAFAIERLQSEEQSREPTVTFKEREFYEKIKNAKAAGYEEGYAVATEKGIVERKTLADDMTELLKDIGLQVREELARLEISCVGLSLQIAYKLIRNSVEINPEYILPILREGFHLAGVSDIFRIRVSQQDLEFIKICGATETMKADGALWEFVEDSTIRSGCVIETSTGEIDLQLDKAFEKIKDDVVKLIL